MNNVLTFMDPLSVALAQLPSGWETVRVGQVMWVRARLGWRGLTADEYVDDGYAFLATPNIRGRQVDFDDVNYITRERFLESPEIILSIGDVLLTKDGAGIGTVNFVTALPRPATVNGSIAVLTPRGRITSSYMKYVLESHYGQSLMDLLKAGMGVPHLFQWDISRMRIPCPPHTEQLEITGFLDRETAQIDATIDAQQRLVEALRARRVATIWHGVTKGLGNADLTPSGVDWIGEVPQHWDVTRLRNSIQSAVPGVWGDDPRGDDSDVKCVRVADFDRPRNRVLSAAVETMRSVNWRDRDQRELRRGDLLLEKSGGTAINPVGFVVRYESDDAAVYSNFITRLRLVPGQDSDLRK